jgi:hypothetical protein
LVENETFHHFFILACILLTGCNPVTPDATPETISVEYTAASTPWLATIYKCAGGNVVNAELLAADFQDPQSFDLSIRIGQPDTLTSPAYQIGSEEIIIIVNPQNTVKQLTVEQVRGLFTGQILNWQAVGVSNGNVQVWVYSSGEDVQQIFEKAALGGNRVTGNARLATSPDEMTRAIAADVNAVGILTSHWKNSNVIDAFNAATAPVLVISKSEPLAAAKSMIACLQNKTP